MTDEATRAQLERIIGGQPEGVILLETDGRITYANAAALAMHGAADLETLGPTVQAYRARYVVTEGTTHAGAPASPASHP